jgi:hypothetical protein
LRPGALRGGNGLGAADTDRLLAMMGIAVKRNIGGRTLKVFLKFFGAKARRALAGDDRTSGLVLHILAEAPSWWVRRDLAQREKLPARIEKPLTSDNNHTIRVSVAKRPTLTADTPALMRREYPMGEQPSM